ncbi:acyl-CoA-like ligand-binding transcription factor [Streptomyces sp. JNUCC 63]
MLATAIAAYEHWLAEEEASLSDLLDLAMRQLADGLGTV